MKIKQICLLPDGTSDVVFEDGMEVRGNWLHAYVRSFLGSGLTAEHLSGSIIITPGGVAYDCKIEGENVYLYPSPQQREEYGYN